MNLESNDYYRRISSEYSEVSHLRKLYLQSINTLLKPLVDQILSNEGAWLDVGSGDGRRLVDLCESFEPDLTVVEPVTEFVNEIKRNLPFANVFQGTLEDYGESPRASGQKFELVSCLWNVIGHSSDPRKFILGLVDLLSDDGTLVFDVNNRLNVRQYGVKNVARNLWNATRGYDWTRFRFTTTSPLGGHKTLTLLSSPGEIEAALMEAGLVVQRRFFVAYDDGKVYPFSWWNGQMYFEVKKRSTTSCAT